MHVFSKALCYVCKCIYWLIQRHPLFQMWSLLAPKKQNGDGQNATLKGFKNKPDVGFLLYMIWDVYGHESHNKSVTVSYNFLLSIMSMNVEQILLLSPSATHKRHLWATFLLPEHKQVPPLLYGKYVNIQNLQIKSAYFPVLRMHAFGLSWLID